MDDKARKAEQLLEERARNRGPNGASATHSGEGSDERTTGAAINAAQQSEEKPATADENVAALQRMAADFSNYRKRMEAEGLQAIDSLGKPFDPYQHDAVAHVESDEPEGTVIKEHQKAYRLHDRVIRPAMVTVAKKKES